MIANIDPEPDQPRLVLLVGQDIAGHWLVQESTGLLEGRFVSHAAAIAFALAERGGRGNADVVITHRPLVPSVQFTPPHSSERALASAA